MLDHIKHTSSFFPSYQRHGSRGSKGDTEFEFWSSSETQYREDFSHGGRSNDIKFRAEEDFTDSYPPLRRRNASRIISYESSPLLPLNHHYSNFSPRSRVQAITEGRKELMEMIHNMPESSYELSLKDIVDEQHALQSEQEETAGAKEANFDFTKEDRTEKQKEKRNRNSRLSQISRSGSMEKETFLLKMFMPTCLSWTPKARSGNSAKMTSSLSFDKSKNHNDKRYSVKRLWVVGEGVGSNRSRSSRTCKGRSDSSTSSHGNSNPSPGCWAFFCTNKK